VRRCAPYEFIGRPGVITFGEDTLSNTENVMETPVRMSDSVGRLSGRGDDSTKIARDKA
jgi:hypothetical protein